MVGSETDKAWEDSKVSLTEAEKKQKNKERMAEIRAKRKPPKLANVHQSVLELPDDHPFSYKNVKQWIETQKGISSSAGLVERSRNRDMPQKDRDKAMRTRMGADAYIRSIRRYISTGDWDAYYYGEYEDRLTKWKTIAPSGKDINSSEEKQ